MPADRSYRSASWLSRGGGALLVSAVVHAAAAATIGGVFGSPVRSAGDEGEALDVDVAPLANAPSPPGKAGTVSTARAPSALRPRQAARPAPRQASAAAVPAAVPPDDDAATPRFALSAGTVATGRARAPSPTTPNPTAAGSGPTSAERSALGDGDLDVPARLLAASPLVYPPAARQAEIELDVPLEIVVDAAGRVISARTAGRAGYGLDEAALQAIRDYRFSPAIRAGRPVPVRMRWTVQFRLR